MDKEKSGVKGKIVAAAAEIVGNQIGANFTIRELAKKANVNVAAVNYYFNSKDNLMQEVERTFAAEFKNINMSLSGARHLPPKERLLEWAEKLMSYLMKYPGAASLFILNVVSNWNSTVVPELIHGLSDCLLPVVKEFAECDDFKTAYYFSLYIMSGVIMPILLHHAAGSKFDVNISNQECRREYIETFLQHFTPPLP